MAMMTMFKKMTMTTKAMVINLKMASVGARKEKVPPWMIGKRQPRLLWSLISDDHSDKDGDKDDYLDDNSDKNDNIESRFLMIIVIKMVIHLEKGDKTGDKEDGGDDITWVFCWGKHFDDDGDL